MNAEPYIVKQYFECACYHPTHMVKVEYDERDNEVVLSIQPHRYEGFFKRIVGAFKHVFMSEELRWDSTILKPEDAARMIAVLRLVRDDRFPDQEIGIDGKIY